MRHYFRFGDERPSWGLGPSHARLFSHRADAERVRRDVID
jgi:hypothetical protein